MIASSKDILTWWRYHAWKAIERCHSGCSNYISEFCGTQEDQLESFFLGLQLKPRKSEKFINTKRTKNYRLNIPSSKSNALHRFWSNLKNISSKNPIWKFPLPHPTPCLNRKAICASWNDPKSAHQLKFLNVLKAHNFVQRYALNGSQILPVSKKHERSQSPLRRHVS